MPNIEINAEKVIGETGEGITILANPNLRSHCEMPYNDPKEGAQGAPGPNTCPNFDSYRSYSERSEGADSLTCKLDSAISNEGEVEELIKAARCNCPVVRAWVSLQALKASETSK